MGKDLIRAPGLSADLSPGGEVFTKPWIVRLMLDLSGYTRDADLSRLRAIEPSCGDGAFLVEMVHRLSQSLKAHGKRLSDARSAIRAYDLSLSSLVTARSRVREVLRADDWPEADVEEALELWFRQADFLLDGPTSRTADLVIGNPPYVRVEDVPPALARRYQEALSTMTGRADIFVGFYEKGLGALRPGGRLAFIAPDRWMRNAYGRKLRQLVSENFSMDLILEMHTIDAFDKRVSAYPAITVIAATPQGRVGVAEAKSSFNERLARELVNWALNDSDQPLRRNGLVAAWSPHWFRTADGWPSGSPERLALVARLEERFPLLRDTGVEVGIGLASGANRVYVTQDPLLVECDRLLPLAMRSDLKGTHLDWSGNFLVNPWDGGALVDLGEWPRLSEYYAQHWKALVSRRVARDHPDAPFRTIDKPIEGLREAPKLLFGDIVMRIQPAFDPGQYYPHQSLYWVTSESWDLKVLGGLLLSDVGHLFLSTYCTRMRGGALRMQAQYIRRVRVPAPGDIPSPLANALRSAFADGDVGAATEAAFSVYGIDLIPA